jgi:hypothetical protein
MTVNTSYWRGLSSLLLIGCMASGSAPGKEDAVKLDVLKRALAIELSSVQDTLHPMRFRLRKSSPRLATTQEICETRDGAVARLIAINDRPLSAADAQKEESRLNALLSDPGKQRHRKQSEVEDTNRVLNVIRALPTAFTYEYAGSGEGPAGKVEKFAFRPNPDFDPPDLETQALTAMSGEIWIDAAEGRVVRLEGRLQRDVDFGWGILGRLNKGGSIVIEQADIGNHQWRLVRFQMVMSGRVVFRNKVFDTEERESNFAPVPVGLGYTQAIEMLRSDSGDTALAGK